MHVCVIHIYACLLTNSPYCTVIVELLFRTNPPQFTANPPQFTANPPQFTANPPQFTANPPQFTLSSQPTLLQRGGLAPLLLRVIDTPPFYSPDPFSSPLSHGVSSRGEVWLRGSPLLTPLARHGRGW
jgi:hypothetical protein